MTAKVPSFQGGWEWGQAKGVQVRGWGGLTSVSRGGPSRRNYD